MKIKAKFDLLHGGRNIKQGEIFEVAEADAPALLALGYEKAEAEKKAKAKTKKSAKESAEG